MDNASFHHSERVSQMCEDAGVKLVLSTTLFAGFESDRGILAELKAFIKRNWNSFEADPDQGFDVFLLWCIWHCRCKARNCERPLSTYRLKDRRTHRMLGMVPVEEHSNAA
jgi:hypothetical protein